MYSVVALRERFSSLIVQRTRVLARRHVSSTIVFDSLQTVAALCLERDTVLELIKGRPRTLRQPYTIHVSLMYTRRHFKCVDATSILLLSKLYLRTYS